MLFPPWKVQILSFASLSHLFLFSIKLFVLWMSSQEHYLTERDDGRGTISKAQVLTVLAKENSETCWSYLAVWPPVNSFSRENVSLILKTKKKNKRKMKLAYDPSKPGNNEISWKKFMLNHCSFPWKGFASLFFFYFLFYSCWSSFLDQAAKGCMVFNNKTKESQKGIVVAELLLVNRKKQKSCWSSFRFPWKF